MDVFRIAARRGGALARFWHLVAGPYEDEFGIVATQTSWSFSAFIAGHVPSALEKKTSLVSKAFHTQIISGSRWTVCVFRVPAINRHLHELSSVRIGEAAGARGRRYR